MTEAKFVAVGIPLLLWVQNLLPGHLCSAMTENHSHSLPILLQSGKYKRKETGDMSALTGYP